MKKAVLLISIIIILLLSTAVAEDLRTHVTLTGGANHHFEYGSVDDYIPGENSFPVMPAHDASSFGLSFAYFFNPSLGLEIDGAISSSSQVTLTDPSDIDTVEVETARHFSLTFNVLYQRLLGRFNPYLALGAGFDRLSAEDQKLISAYGYEIVMLAPPEGERVDFTIGAGGGLNFFIFKNIGLRLDIRYFIIFDDPHNVRTVSLKAGLCFRI
ncbi:MAG: outer membrane beta-barrel protein [Candidatus Aminicenantes bacterium]|nr:outer membrane beta-barrel protein [Candidatus Aminicenantes bacterium]